MAKKKKKKPSKKPLYAAFIALGLTFAGETIIKKSHEGVDRWEVKVLADDQNHDIDYKHPIRTTIDSLVNIPTAKSTDKKPRQPVELHVYKIECYIDDKIYEDDGDIHLVLRSTETNETMIGEIPFPYYPTAEKSGFKTKFVKVRKQFHKLHDNNPDFFKQTYIVTGVGFVDFFHNQTGHADNNLELHPVLSIEKK